MELNGRSVRALVLVISIALEGDSDVAYATFALFFLGSEEIGNVAAAASASKISVLAASPVISPGGTGGFSFQF